MTRISKKQDNSSSILIKYCQPQQYFPQKFKKNHTVMKAKKTDNSRLRIIGFKQKKMRKQHKVSLRIWLNLWSHKIKK
jgi:hypothetical protein